MDPVSQIDARRQAARDEETARAARKLGRRHAWLGLLAVLAVAAIVRLPLLAFPMGSEAGVLGYVGRRWIGGWLPYREVWDTHMPAIYLIAGLVVRGLGATALACRSAMFLCDLGTLALVYAIVRQWCNRTEAVTAAALYGLFSGGVRIQGDWLSTSPPMALLVALAFLAALRSKGQGLGWLFLCGLAAGAAVCVRLAAGFYVAALVLWVMAAGAPGSGRVTRWVARPGAILVGALLPLAACVAYFAHCRGLADFWQGAFVYNYLTHRPLGGADWAATLRSAVRSLAPEQGALWLFAAGWAIHAFSVGFRRETGLIVLWGAVAVASVLTDYRVEADRFLEAVPPLAIGAALAVTNPSEPFLRRDASGRLESRSTMLVLFTVTLALGFLWAEWRGYNGRVTDPESDRNRAAAEVARIIAQHTTTRDRIYVWGTWPQIYVLADRPAAYRVFYGRPGPHVLAEAVVKLKPCFMVMTEEDLTENIAKIGAITGNPNWLREEYHLARKIVDVRRRDLQPRQPSFTISARNDRAGDDLGK